MSDYNNDLTKLEPMIHDQIAQPLIFYFNDLRYEVNKEYAFKSSHKHIWLKIIEKINEIESSCLLLDNLEEKKDELKVKTQFQNQNRTIIFLKPISDSDSGRLLLINDEFISRKAQLILKER